MGRTGNKSRVGAVDGGRRGSDRPFVWAVHGALVCLFAGLGAFAALDPDSFRDAMQEDALAEWATFWLFMASGAAAGFTAWRTARSAGGTAGAWPTAVGLAGLTLFCLFVAGEEISWGQRFFGFRPPALFLESNYQQELNIHNLFMEIIKTRLLVAAVALGYGVLLPLLARVTNRSAAWPWRWIRVAAPAPGLWLWFLIIVLVELAYPVSFAGEAAELGLAAVFLADVWLRTRAVAPLGPLFTPLAVVAVTLAVLVLSRTTMVVGEIVASAGDQALIDRAEDDLDRLSDDLATGNAIQPSLLQPGGVHQRVFTAAGKGHLRFAPDGRFRGNRADNRGEAAASLRNRQDYFLDPWHNSYWIYANKRAGYALLYSMGPNRRRDTPVTTLIPSELRTAEMLGDDVGIAIELGPGIR